MGSTSFASLVVTLLWGIALHSASALPATAGEARVLERASQVKHSYDYIIIGGGTSGLTVGDRLTEDGKYNVLVIEVGILDNDTAVLSGGALAGWTPNRLYSINSTPQPGLNNATTNVFVGKVVGGSSAVNGMVFLRGTSDEYDTWGPGQLGSPNSTWDWKGLLPYFKKGIHFTPPIEDLAKDFNITYDIPGAWGQDPNTKIYASYPNYVDPALKLGYQAFHDMPNVDFPKDGNAGTNGVFFWPTSMEPTNYTRSYARTGHWDPVGPGRDNYELITGSKVTKILFTNGVATGVTFTPADGGEATIVKATKEIILAAGAVHTPQVLQLSGIGPSALLKQANISVIVDLPGVGQNFQDQGYVWNVGFDWGIQPPVPNSTTGGDPSTATSPNCGAWLGLPVISDNYEKIASDYAAQDPAAYLPEGTDATVVAGYKVQQVVHAAMMRKKNVSFLELLIGAGPGGSVINLHTVSRGTINIDPNNLTAEPLVDYRAMSNPTDMRLIVEMVRYMRKYMASATFAPYQPVETSPGISIQTDDEIAAWIRGIYSPTVYHPIGTTAKMPRELGGVVDEDLLVYGVQKLSVIDAGIMPSIPGSTTSMTVYAIAEKAADIIKSRQ